MSDAKQIAEERLAKGEISEAEFDTLIAKLGGNGTESNKSNNDPIMALVGNILMFVGLGIIGLVIFGLFVFEGGLNGKGWTMLGVGAFSFVLGAVFRE